MGNQSTNCVIGRELFSRKTLRFCASVGFFIKAKCSKRITSYPRGFWSTLLLLPTILMSSKDRRERIQQPQFREAPRQISSPFVLPLVRCQSMNSVCLAHRAHRRTCTHVYFNRFVILPGRRPREMLNEHSQEGTEKWRARRRSNSGQCSRRQTPTARLSRPFSRIVINL